VGVADANIFDIEYPVPELGNCESQEECKVFCDKEENQMVCMSFAESKNIIPEDIARQIKDDLRRFEEEMDDFGPGGCITPRECDAYCRVLDNLDECLDYGVAHGHQTQAEAEAIREQANKGGPGGCHSREECDNFCRQPENSQECFAFVIEEGKITQEEADFMIERMKTEKERHKKDPVDIDVEKAQLVLEEKGGPGGCKTMEECGKYCQGFEHSAECLEFAIENDLIDPSNLERIKQLSSMKSGPGGCMTDEECDAFCSSPGNQDECMRFMKENKLVSDKELQLMEREIKIMMKLDSPGGMGGPGGCRGSEECDAYCSDPAHIEECISFGSQQGGMMDKRTVDKMMGQTKEAQDKMRQTEEEGMNFFGDFDEFRDIPENERGDDSFRAGFEIPMEEMRQMMEGMSDMSDEEMRKDFEARMMGEDMKDFPPKEMLEQMLEGEMDKEFEMMQVPVDQVEFLEKEIMDFEYPTEESQIDAKINPTDLLGSMIAPFVRGFLGR